MLTKLNRLKVPLNKSNVLLSLRNSSTTTVKKPLFDKILIANRGEIALRVMRTAKQLGVKTVAVYSEADRDAQHAKQADEAYCIGPAASSQSYLRMDKIVEVARKSGAQAIHPGYGFLSENSDFADLLSKEDITFVGPPASAMISMGSKSESKKIMESAGVPVVPGYHGENQDPNFLKEQAAKIGYPVLIKAIKGGGGKGMRIATNAEEFLPMLESSKREALKSFSDDKVLVEKYLTTPRHVEVQIFADTFGNCVHLYERDCSVQRRHQKVLEESPAPNLSKELQQEFGAKAVAAAKAVGYVGAGTVEFIMDNETGKFYFMEMNTRLQVEHPVTEMVTNVDLVQWQLDVAAGNPLPLTQNQIQLKGHAFEARIYAEDPDNNFLPDVGPLAYVRTPEPKENLVRVETGVIQGDQVSVHYDPMIAKLVVYGDNRNEALKKLVIALKQYKIVGLKTNLDFLARLAQHPEFVQGNVETGFIPKFENELFPSSPQHISTELIIPAVLRLLQAEIELTKNNSVNSNDINSPWNLNDKFQPNLKPKTKFELIYGKQESQQKLEVEVDFNIKANTYDFKITYPDKHVVDVNDVKLSAVQENDLVIDFNNSKLKCTAVPYNNTVQVFHPTLPTLQLSLPTPKYLLDQDTALAGSVLAPMPSKISQVLVKKGDAVKQGQPLLVLEAMKMEHTIKAPKDAIVDKVKFGEVGMLVPDKAVLVTFVEESKE